MGLYVLKFGGTSVGSIDRIKHVAQLIGEQRDGGHDVVVAVSAMSGETDRLLGLAKAIDAAPPPRELDVLLATGEQVTIALLAMTLETMGYAARSYTGAQVTIRTDGVHGKARILAVDERRIRADLELGRVVVVAGFQGVDAAHNITTLGRGGSDTTAVALAAAMKADECKVFTDVDGVFTTDPRMVPEARRLQRVTFEEMLEMASLGAKVLQIRSVEFASKFGVPLRVLSTFGSNGGTLIAPEDGQEMETPLISGIAFNRDEAKITVLGVQDRPGIASSILEPVAAANIEVDMIVQNAGRDGSTDFTFTVHRSDFGKAMQVVEAVRGAIGAQQVIGDNRIAKISLVGVGMRSHAGIASKMFRALAIEGINILMISTSEIKISAVVDEKYLELGVRSLHSAFALEQDSNLSDESLQVN
ncbi:MAG: aspartate kinase [Gammaproteobacteria bacterium]|nr:aspartate kinase [Gammaproteobacteria bacterium]